MDISYLRNALEECTLRHFCNEYTLHINLIGTGCIEDSYFRMSLALVPINSNGISKGKQMLSKCNNRKILIESKFGGRLPLQKPFPAMFHVPHLLSPTANPEQFNDCNCPPEDPGNMTWKWSVQRLLSTLPPLFLLFWKEESVYYMLSIPTTLMHWWELRLLTNINSICSMMVYCLNQSLLEGLVCQLLV